VIDRRAFLGAVAGGLLTAPLAVEAHQAGRVYRIGYLTYGTRPSDGRPPVALRDALVELGYVEGKIVTYVGRWAEAKRDRLPGLAAELVDLKVDLIVTLGIPAAEAARAATSTIPIVIASAEDAVGIGLIASLARPGANITGITDQAELSAKRLEFLKEAVPKASRIAVLWNADHRAMTLRYRGDRAGSAYPARGRPTARCARAR
jgi:putative tryptophan/tyrosine transport system substrate-binding protein